MMTESSKIGRPVHLPIPGRPLALAALALAALAAMASGCGQAGEPKNFTNISTWAEFQQRVLQADKPVLMDFYKDSCPTCVYQEGFLDKMAEDYQGRVYFVRMKIFNAFRGSLCPEVEQHCKIFWVPTVILFNNGQEQQRWELNHMVAEFREGLDKVAAPATAQRPPGATAPTPGAGSF